MNAVKNIKQGFNIDPSMRGPLIASAIFHLSIFIFAAVGLPYTLKEPPLISTPMSVEIVEIDEKTKAKEKPKINPKPIQEKKPEPPKEKPKPKETAPKMTEAAPPKPPKPAPMKKEAEVPAPKPKKPEPKPEPKEEKPEKDFQTLLRNLAPDASEERPQEMENQKESESDAPAVTLAERVTMSEMDAFKRQIQQCWNIPTGAKYAEDLVIQVRVTVNRDRTVQSASILNRGRYNQDSYFRAAADSALRALRNPRCSPLNLPPEKYEQWKAFTIRFDPREML